MAVNVIRMLLKKVSLLPTSSGTTKSSRMVFAGQITGKKTRSRPESRGLLYSSHVRTMQTNTNTRGVAVHGPSHVVRKYLRVPNREGHCQSQGNPFGFVLIVKKNLRDC